MYTLRILLIITSYFIIAGEINAQNNSEAIQELKTKIESQNSEIQSLKNQVDSNRLNLTQNAGNYAPMGLVLFLFGGFCALWAQNTGRNPWTWFFVGVILSVLAVIQILINNSREQSEEK